MFTFPQDQPDIHFEDEDAIAADLDNEMEVDDPDPVNNVASPGGGEVNIEVSFHYFIDALHTAAVK